MQNIIVIHFGNKRQILDEIFKLTEKKLVLLMILSNCSIESINFVVILAKNATDDTELQYKLLQGNCFLQGDKQIITILKMLLIF